MKTEDISMKVTRTIIVCTGFLLMLSLSGAVEKPVEKGHFLSVNPNIKNEELKSKLEILKHDFDIEQKKIQDYYTKEIEH